MSDKIFQPNEIPEGFFYGDITRDYITFYNKPSFRNESATYYRVYYTYSSGLVVSGTTNFGNYTTTFSSIPVSRNIMDRPDFYKIVIIVFIISILGLFIFNLITSFIKKGGLLGGLL